MLDRYTGENQASSAWKTSILPSRQCSSINVHNGHVCYAECEFEPVALQPESRHFLITTFSRKTVLCISTFNTLWANSDAKLMIYFFFLENII